MTRTGFKAESQEISGWCRQCLCFLIKIGCYQTSGQIWNYHRRGIEKLTFRALALCQSERRRVTLEGSAFQIFNGGNFSFVHMFDKTKFSCLTLPPTQHQISLKSRNLFVFSQRQLKVEKNSLLCLFGNQDKLQPKTWGDFNAYKIWAQYLSIGNKYFHSCLNELVKNRTLALVWNDALHQFTFTLKLKHFPQTFTPNQT